MYTPQGYVHLSGKQFGRGHQKLFTLCSRVERGKSHLKSPASSSMSEFSIFCVLFPHSLLYLPQTCFCSSLYLGGTSRIPGSLKVCVTADECRMLSHPVEVGRRAVVSSGLLSHLWRQQRLYLALYKAESRRTRLSCCCAGT